MATLPTNTPLETRTREPTPTPDANGSSEQQMSDKPRAPAHQRLVLTDHVAFRYLEEDPSVTVLVRRQKLEGYEVYLVEQWACARTHATFIITTYSGDPRDTAWGSIVSVPADESAWSPHLKVYFKALDECHARPTETSHGTLMVTNLGAFPSSLTVIPVPGGDAKKSWDLFYVNVNLKRLGCSGRLGIKLAPPNSATQAKFHQLYRTSDKIPLNGAVIELVQMCQIALVIFAKLEPAYADGLLCDFTEKAINDWWVEFGAEYYGVEAHDGILGPTTVAALLGMLIGARNRLSAHNAPIGKDAFDIESTKRGISYFQKTKSIPRTGLLDRQTLDKLRRATAKAASKEGWTMPRALKSTVAELGGKGGEMVMGMVGAGDKAGIAEIETTDIDRFAELVHGERAKWLWLGKPKKTSVIPMFSRLPGENESSPDAPRDTSGQLKKESSREDHKLMRRETTNDDAKKNHDLAGIDSFDKEKDPYSKRAAIKRATEEIGSVSGFHRIKDAVGRRSHHHKASKDDFPSSKEDVASEQNSLQQTKSATDSEPSFTKTLTETPPDSASSMGRPGDRSSQTYPESQLPPAAREPTEPEESDGSKPPTVTESIAGSIYREVDAMEKLPFEPTDTTPILLRRTQTTDDLTTYHASNRNNNWWPRHLSFSIAEESVMTWSPLFPPPSQDYENNNSRETLEAKLASLSYITTTTHQLSQKISSLSHLDAQWTSQNVSSINDLAMQADADIAELEDMYYARFDEYQAMRDDTHEIVARDRLQLQDTIRDLETLGAKLDYEIQALRSKVDDVDDGVAELERQVEFVEERVRDLERVVGEREGWLHWGIRVLLGVGRPPG